MPLTLGGRCALSSVLVRRRMKSLTMALSSVLRSAPRACGAPSRLHGWPKPQALCKNHAGLIGLINLSS